MREGAALCLYRGGPLLRCGRLSAMDRSELPVPRQGYARCAHCQHVFLVGMLWFEFERLWCPWCLEKRPGTPHGQADAASCECQLLAR